MLTRRISSTVLLGSAHVIQVSYTGTTYIVDCVIGVNSGHRGIICWHDVHRSMFYWGQLGSYGYCTLAWRTSSTVLLGLARDIQVWYPGTPYTSLTVIEVSSGDTGIIRWHDVHCWLCYWGQLRLYRCHTLARRTLLTVLLGSAQIIQVSYAGSTYIVDCVIGVSSGHTGIIRLLDVHHWLCYWGQLKSYSYHTLARRTLSTVLLGVSSGHTGIVHCHDVHR